MKTKCFSLLALLLMAFSSTRGFTAELPKPACGLTIITHGFQGPGHNFPLIGTDGALPAWVREMAQAITNRIGVSLPIYRIRYDKASWFGLTDFYKHNDKIVPDPEMGDVDLTLAGGAIVLLDWVGVANEPYDYPTKIVADGFYKHLFEDLHKGTKLAAVPIHLIGHSRGCSLNSQLAYRLAQEGILIDQVTTLDPHPVNRLSGVDLLTQFVDAAYSSVFSTYGTDVLPKSFKNIIFADNYYQTEDSPEGQYISGTYDQKLNGVINSGMPARQHEQIHTYYHGTIDLSPQV